MAFRVPPHANSPLMGIAPLTPDGNGADLGKVLLDKNLWKFLHNVGQSANGVGGDAGGDLSGTYPDPSVVKIQGHPVQSATPSTGDILTWSGTQWIPASPSVTPGAATVDAHILTADTTINASVTPAPVNGILVVMITQDATGHWVPTFDPADFIVAPTSLNMLPSTYSAIMFAAHAVSGKWMMVAPPMTGRT